MDHHPVPDIDAHVARTAGVVGPLKEDEVPGLCFALRDDGALFAEALRRKPAIVPAVPAVVDHIGHEAGAVESAGR